MRIKSPIGIGEIVVIKLLDENSFRVKARRKMGDSDEIGKVVGLKMNSSLNISYEVIYRTPAGYELSGWFQQNQLEGDPQFNQITLSYPQPQEPSEPEEEYVEDEEEGDPVDGQD